MTNHFDNYQARRGGLSSPCQGLGGCDPHRARAEQQEAVERSMPAKIETVKKEIQQIKNGVQQKEFDLLKQKRTALAEKIVSLDAQITRAKLLVDAWEKSPKQQAGIEGLGWGWWNRNIKGTWNAAFSCQHYEERLNESIARTRPLENQLTEQNTTLTNLKAQLSPENLAIQRNADSVVNRVEDMLNLAGGVANVINMFKGGRPINVGGQQLSQAQARQLYESAVAKEEGRLDDYVEDNLLYTDNNANNFMQQYLQQKMMAEMMGGNKPKDNTALYIGLGVGGVVLIAMMMMMMQKK